MPTQYQLILQLGAQVGENEVEVACRDELSGLVMQFVVVWAGRELEACDGAKGLTRCLQDWCWLVVEASKSIPMW